jgi:hypothetical protein
MMGSLCQRFQHAFDSADLEVSPEKWNHLFSKLPSIWNGGADNFAQKSGNHLVVVKVGRKFNSLEGVAAEEQREAGGGQAPSGARSK